MCVYEQRKSKQTNEQTNNNIEKIKIKSIKIYSLFIYSHGEKSQNCLSFSTFACHSNSVFNVYV